ncbi:MAG: hypothetical protein ABSH28_24645 [Acidobacteriota bacterium]
MLPTIIAVCVYVIVISNAAYLVVEMYRFVKRKFVKEPEPERPQTTFSTTFSLVDLPEYREPTKKSL